MAKKVQNLVKNGEANSEKTTARSTAYFDRGIRDSRDLVNMSLAVCGDMVTGRLTASIGNSVCANVRNVIKIEELKNKYGALEKDGKKNLLLA